MDLPDHQTETSQRRRHCTQQVQKKQRAVTPTRQQGQHQLANLL